MSLLINNNDTPIFICTHQIKVTYIVTPVNFPSFSASDTMVFIYFLKTITFYGYLMTPFSKEALYNHHLFARPLTTVIHQTIKHLLHFTHASQLYATSLLRNSLPTNNIPSYAQSYICTAYLSRIS